jgi:CRISPR-associated protein Cas1
METLPKGQIEGVVVLGGGNVTTPALHALMDADIPIHYVDNHGRYKGSLTSGRGRGYAIRRLQYEAAQSPDTCLTLARTFIAGKLLGQRRTLLRYFYRKKEANLALKNACDELERLSMSAVRHTSATLDDLRGMEGIGAMKYFSALSGVLRSPWIFPGRNRRPPRDPVNALLSFGYTLLLSSVTTAVTVAGLDPCVGFVHPEYRGRPSLALDMMEEFRSPIVDRMVVGSCNQGLFQMEDFISSENKGVIMNASAKKSLLKAYDERLKTIVKNESTGENATYENHIRMQAALFVRCLREQLNYLPFICGH